MDSITDPVARYLLQEDDHPDYIPNETRKYLIEKEKCCKVCGSKENLQIDHKFPVSEGGRCYLDNLQVLCRNCNLAKSNRSLDPRSYTKKYVIPMQIKTEMEIIRLVMEKVQDERA